MIRFMYGLDYNHKAENPSPMRFHFSVYQIADSYKVSHLKKHALEKLEAVIKASWSIKDFFLILRTSFEKFWYAEYKDLWLCLDEACYKRIDDLVGNEEFENLVNEQKDLPSGIYLDLAHRKKHCSPCNLTFFLGSVSEDEHWKVSCPKCHQLVGDNRRNDLDS